MRKLKILLDFLSIRRSIAVTGDLTSNLQAGIQNLLKAPVVVGPAQIFSTGFFVFWAYRRIKISE